MANFGWADTARAIFGSCLPCFRANHHSVRDDEDRQRLGRRDELEGLLHNAEFNDADADVETMSLHSHIGRSDGRTRVKKKKRGKGKGSIKLFGYDLFGRPLPVDDEGNNSRQDEEDVQRRISRLSSSTLDSDAAPLADDAIAHSVQADLERRDAEAIRPASGKALRKQKKIVAALSNTEGESFEGFPGSGPPLEDFGAFQQAPVAPAPELVGRGDGGRDQEEDADADFDADSYLKSSSSHRSDSGSGTRSRTSASMSNTQERSSHYPIPPAIHPPSSDANPKPKRSTKKSRSKRSATTGSTGTSSEPRSPVPAPHSFRVDIASPTATWEGYPKNDGAFEGVPFDSDFSMPSRPDITGQPVHGDSVMESAFSSTGGTSAKGFPSPGFSRSAGLPSPGLSGRKNSLTAGGGGAFLARTGDDE